MAYLMKLTIRCNEPGCTKRATVQLFDWINESRGKYCSPHGNKKLKDRNEFEETHNRDGSTIKPKTKDN